MKAVETQSDTKKWLSAVCRIAEVYGHPVDEIYLSQQMSWFEKCTLEQKLIRLSALINLQIKPILQKNKKLTAHSVPFIVARTDNELAVVHSINTDDSITFWLTDGSDITYQLPAEEFWEQNSGLIVLIHPETRGRDSRIDEFIKPYKKHWFLNAFRGSTRNIMEISLASIVSNTLALAGILFSMQIYDRIIPAESYNSLWVLFFGVMIAVLFEALVRMARTSVSDIMGKNIDLKVSSMLFARALAIRNEARPKSTGAFISQLRELEQVRELITSTTVGAVADMPFVILFLFLMAAIGGPLVIIPMLAIPLVVIPGLILQWPLSKLSQQGMRESALRNAVLVESIEGVEDIKALQAEPYFQRQWEQNHEVSAEISIKHRLWTSLLTGWGGAIQQLSYSAILVMGVYLVLKGDITTGTLVACSMLSSRTIAPLMQLTMVFSRWQHAKTAIRGLDELLKKPIDMPEDEKRAHCPNLYGNYTLQGVEYAYDTEHKKSVLSISKLEINHGERIAIIGRVGAGKSTLLKLLAGQGTASQGKVLLDGVDISRIDPADIRRQVGYVSQDCRLFFGSLRQNLMLGHPHATEQELIQALVVSGAISLVQKDAAILDYVINEGGRGLSGGQRQMILLSRMLVRNPKVVLMDEPTTFMDENLEKHVLQQLDQWIGGRTMVLVTHRPALINIVNRIIVIDNGRIVADGSKEQILRTYGSPTVEQTGHAKNATVKHTSNTHDFRPVGGNIQ
ncbi:type I secretion system permease/ATPase [Serratia sp. UGAL515B_01]|uniref:type I secretion system permease/ATPase n=1 Tax=Serratia sp. UGAL515B_01 TaxID=2986763 RepID=UPI00295368C4|nr:type I secretion system permease/ATPase [Serratia sp. UGAL515B_01]WON77520.1 type I secretion system permease/ATPase [Serratia sp. UGAL515B_01]